MLFNSIYPYQINRSGFSLEKPDAAVLVVHRRLWGFDFGEVKLPERLQAIHGSFERLPIDLMKALWARDQTLVPDAILARIDEQKLQIHTKHRGRVWEIGMSRELEDLKASALEAVRLEKLCGHFENLLSVLLTDPDQAVAISGKTGFSNMALKRTLKRLTRTYEKAYGECQNNLSMESARFNALADQKSHAFHELFTVSLHRALEEIVKNAEDERDAIEAKSQAKADEKLQKELAQLENRITQGKEANREIRKESLNRDLVSLNAEEERNRAKKRIQAEVEAFVSEIDGVTQEEIEITARNKFDQWLAENPEFDVESPSSRPSYYTIPANVEAAMKIALADVALIEEMEP